MQKLTKQQELINNYTSLDLEKLKPKIITKHYVYDLIKRSDRKCLYSVSDGGRIVAYEVIKTRIRKHRERMAELKNRQGYPFIPENYAEYKEAWPCDEDFGKRAWTYSDLESAEEVYEKL